MCHNQIEKYVRTFRVNSFDSDSSKNLKLHSLFQIFSEIGWDHAKILNFGFEDLIASNKFWVLTSIRVKVNQLPVWQDDINVHTWPSGKDGICFTREYEIYSKSGDLLVQASSNWIVFDNERKRPVIPKEYDFIKDSKFEKTDLTGHIKLKAVDDMEKLSDEEARATDIDMHQHVNNSVYIRWIENCLNKSELSNKFMFEVQFIKEQRINSKVEVFGKSDSATQLFEIKSSDNKACVRAHFKLYRDC